MHLHQLIAKILQIEAFSLPELTRNLFRLVFVDLLLNFLDQALKDLAKGKTSQAVKKLNDFIDRIQDLLDDGTLNLSEGQPLIDAANTAILSTL